MDFLRHAARHVHHTVANELQAQLTDLGWFTDGQVPFGAAKVTMMRTPAFVGSTLNKDITAGVLAVTVGDEFMPTMEELGGPLSIQEYPIFCDVFQDSNASAIALASDIRDILLGRLPGTRRFLDVINQANGQVVPGWKIEMDDIERTSPNITAPLNWQVVKATAVVYFPEVAF